MDSRIINCQFIGYSERLSDFEFYDPLSMSFFEMANVKFIEDSGSTKLRNITLEEENIDDLTMVTTIVISSYRYSQHY